MASKDQVALLDHIIVLLPHEELLNPSAWITDNFSLTDGGRHADGKTENKLIVFQDGSYIELISFINDLPENRSGHWWGAKPYSIIDWCFTTSTDYNAHHEILVSRLDAAQAESSQSTTGVYSYQPPQLGGRTRPDGVKLEWAVTFPTYTPTNGGEATRPPNLPFFCHDVTPRSNRVNGVTNHPCGALGISEVRVLVGDNQAEEFGKYIASAVNSGDTKEDYKKGIPVGAFHGGQNSNVVFLHLTNDEESEKVKQYGFVLKQLAFDCGEGKDEATFSYPL